MEISRQQVEHIAELSRLALSGGEVDLYRTELSAILSYMDKLNEADTRAVPPQEHACPVSPHLRDDRVKASLPAGEILGNAPDREGGHFKVPKVIG